MVNGLLYIVKFYVDKCGTIKEIVLRDNSSSAQSDMPNKILEFISLKSLTLYRFHTLHNFYSKSRNCKVHTNG